MVHLVSLRSSEDILKKDVLLTLQGSRSNVLPGAFMFGIFGMMGQATYNSLRSSGEELETQPPYIQRLLNSRWVPLKHLSDEEYVGMLNEKTVRIDAEIAILDERITVLEKSKATGG